MHHIAIMNKKLKLIDKILSGEKKIESRWYVNRIAPWGRIEKDDIVYFKDAGSPVTAKAEVEKLIYFSKHNNDLFSNIQEFDVDFIMKNYAKDICIQDIKGINKYANGKNYCILIFLKNPKKLEPFDVDKTGFGNACAWMCVGNMDDIKVN